MTSKPSQPLPWPPSYSGQPRLETVSLDGLRLGMGIEEVERRTGAPAYVGPNGLGGWGIYQGPVVVESCGSTYDSAAAIYGTHLMVGDRALEAGASRAEVVSVVGDGHARYPGVDFYRFVDNRRLGVVYKADRADYFVLHDALAAHEKYGWDSAGKYSFMSEEERRQFPFDLSPLP